MALMTALKGRALLILGGLVTVLVFLLRVFGLRMKRLKQQRDQAKATVKKQKEVMEADFEIDEQTKSRRVDALNEIRGKRIPDAFDPNSLRKSDD